MRMACDGDIPSEIRCTCIKCTDMSAAAIHQKGLIAMSYVSIFLVRFITEQ